MRKVRSYNLPDVCGRTGDFFGCGYEDHGELSDMEFWRNERRRMLLLRLLRRCIQTSFTDSGRVRYYIVSRVDMFESLSASGWP